MKVLITGSSGFIGKNLITRLKSIAAGKNKELSSELELFLYDKDSATDLLDKYAKDCHFIYHLAGVNRPQQDEEFMEGNFAFTATLIEKLKQYKNNSPILLTSSIQAVLENKYGKSKQASEKLLFDYADNVGAKTLVYRLPNVFGKGCNPNYNSVIATFCYNISRGKEIRINDPNTILKLVYIDDVVNEFINALYGTASKQGKFCYIPTVYEVRLADIVDLLYLFKQCKMETYMPKDAFEKALYNTYLSYLPVYEQIDFN